MENLVDVDDLSRRDIEEIYSRTEEMKRSPESFESSLENRTLLMMFEKPSTRTRVSFESGMTQLGGHAIFFHTKRSQMSRGEEISDTSKVLSRYCDAVMARMYSHDKLVELSESSSIPVINGLTDLLHPCQAISDFFTMKEKGVDLSTAKVVYVGDGNNMAHSLMQTAAKLGVDFYNASPEEYMPENSIVDKAEAEASKKGSELVVTEDVEKAVKDADVVYTDVWASMGDEDSEERKRALKPYQVNKKLLETADPDVKVMHCLPAHRGEEITSEVMDGDHSIVFDQAENRMHVQKAILEILINS
ncbi:MAG: ornithine carbamoyltransferase [Candidatus Nanohaloarchaea archaeon]|nr:ornithine carbamoyltransferase [Candidatus Nanohaloarchaea archaeon]